MHGGDWVAEVFKAQGVRFIFTLTGGHIAPILVGCKQRGIQVVDVRHEANAVFAADAVARLTGVPGVAVVTAGPGVTNTITAVKNAQMAQSPLVLIGGAAATALKGRGALQDIPQVPLFRSLVKWSKSLKRVKDIVPALERAFREAQRGVPGPVFLEIPIDLLYGEQLVRDWYGLRSGGKSLAGQLVQRYLQFHLNRLFAGGTQQAVGPRLQIAPPQPDEGKIQAAAEKLAQAERPLLLVGSQALLDVANVEAVAAAISRLGIPVYLSSMARGLLGIDHPLQLRHKRRDALREADLVLLAGVACDFRLDYGNHIRRQATYISVNRSRHDLYQNRRPTLPIPGDPGLFLRRLAEQFDGRRRWDDWLATLRQRHNAREAEIREQALQPGGKVNPLHLCLEMAQRQDRKVILVADGGDFVGTAAYILQPPGPLTWLDPGPFGTLGVGAGFALGAKLVHPDAEVWIIYGDGSVGYSLAEFDTFVRHQLPVIGVVGNDAAWSQIAREQVAILKDDVATVLAPSDYHNAAIGLGAAGLQISDPELVPESLAEAQARAAAGQPVLVNVLLDKTDFRKGSISV